jgi:hypothetical protein
MASCDVVVIAILAVLCWFEFLGVSNIVFVLVRRGRVKCESSSGRQHIEHSSARDFTEHYL